MNLRNLQTKLRFLRRSKDRRTKLRLEKCGANVRILNGKRSHDIHRYDSKDLKNYEEIASGGSALIYSVHWKDTSKFAVKKFVKSSDKEIIINEIYLTALVNPHRNIIPFYGVTKLEGEKYYSIILEYADGGTLRNYLRDNTKTFKWEKFAKEIVSAISWLHCKEVIHGDLHPDNILIDKDTIKLTDFGRSFLKGSNNNNTKAYGVIPYMDPKMLDSKTSYNLTEKSDIYSLGVLFWELTSRKSPFDFEEINDDLEKINIKQKILNGERENPISGTNDKIVALYKKCWKQEPVARPDIHQVISEINNIDPIDPESIMNTLNNLNSNESRTTDESKDSNLPNCGDCDINAAKYKDVVGKGKKKSV